MYQAEKNDVIENNIGVLVYDKGRLVNRLDYHFGDLFKEAFYKTKFKTATTIFQHLGIIDIKNGLTLNYLGTWFKKNKNYYSFMEKIKDAMWLGQVKKRENEMKTQN